MKVTNSSLPFALSREALERKVLNLFFLKEDFSTLLDQSQITTDELSSINFTGYCFNILQLAVYFQSLSAVETLFKSHDIFKRLLESADRSSDPIIYILMVRPSIDLIKFFFDKIEFRNPICKRLAKNDRCVFWHIHSKDIFPPLYSFYTEQKAFSDRGKDLRSMNIRHLSEFFDLLLAREFAKQHPLSDYFAKFQFENCSSRVTLSTQTSTFNHLQPSAVSKNETAKINKEINDISPLDESIVVDQKPNNLDEVKL